MSPEPPDRARRLADALQAIGMDFLVESRGALALLTSLGADPRPLSNDERQAMLQFARAAGYSHAAVEIKRR